MLLWFPKNVISDSFSVMCDPFSETPDDNDFTGSIASEIGMLTNLKSLNFCECGVDNDKSFVFVAVLMLACQVIFVPGDVVISN